MTRIGLISDTHGLLRPQAIAQLSGCDRIVHAGDIGPAELLEALSRIAPVDAVRGNNDRAGWEHLPERLRLEIDGHVIEVIHDLKQLDIDPAEHGVAIVIAGHSHRPGVETRSGVLYINLGSAGPRRFSLPTTAGELQLGPDGPQARIIDLMQAP